MTFHNTLIEEAYASASQLMRDGGAQRRLRTEITMLALQHHCESNAEFARYAERLSNTGARADTMPFPLLPSGLFKRRALRLASVEHSEIVKYCTSSGTTGQSLSVVPRDEATLLNFLSSIQCSIPEYFGIDRSGGHTGIVLGPSADEAGDLWFSYVLASLGISIQTRFFEREGEFHLEAALEALRAQLSARQPVVIIGPPQRLVDIAEAAAAAPLWPAWTDHSFIISAGGWKGAAGKAIEPASFREHVAKGLRIGDTAAIRDSFNMVELNTVIHECEHHRKHVPPWLDAFAVDPRTNVPLANGRTGILAFVDASATSYPSFILSDDFGVVDERGCGCGREGKTLSIHRRMTRIEARGCALKMSSVAGSAGQSGGSDRYYVSIYRPPRGGEEL